MDLIPADSLDGVTLADVEALYTSSFPDRLRAPFPDLLRDDVTVAVINGTLAGFAVSRDLAHTPWVFLRYFTVAARGRGLGTQLWRRLCRRWAAHGRSWVLLDVEDPDEPGIDHTDQTLRHRRVAFYRRLGVQVLPIRDYAPPHQTAAHPLRLLAADTRAAATAPLHTAHLRDVVLTVYRHRYGLPADDPIVHRTLRSSGLLDTPHPQPNGDIADRARRTGP
ncbi:GNAT family N-acetyltransferase [Micromonospora sp. WMMD1082]|uniref:GNAT family N-acetyltransferase n=1 Tax=Micromonospora sp. WMMD1082 TaxID=3016104 RepID=UPI0024165671|nr:GNAT family N-acetyltransferase [Micromonospora sp. WMMD1082]MDG4795635.1 GNAT family N-acetyltransferase [Micromonospora sp. WMMD1082]